MKNEKLAAVKRRIDQISKSERSVNVQALIASRGRWEEATIQEVTVTVLCEPEPVPKYRGGDGVTPQTSQCWIRGPHGKTKMRIEELIPLDQRAELEAWTRLADQAEAATQEAEKALEAIQRHNADSLMLASKEAAAEEPR